MFAAQVELPVWADISIGKRYYYLFLSFFIVVHDTASDKKSSEGELHCSAVHAVFVQAYQDDEFIVIWGVGINAPKEA